MVLSKRTLTCVSREADGEVSYEDARDLPDRREEK
jgi:hypothetical protein